MFQSFYPRGEDVKCNKKDTKRVKKGAPAGNTKEEKERDPLPTGDRHVERFSDKIVAVGHTTVQQMTAVTKGQPKKNEPHERFQGKKKARTPRRGYSSYNRSGH